MSSEGHPLDGASDPPSEEVPRLDMLSFENEQERSPEPLPEWLRLLELLREQEQEQEQERERLMQLLQRYFQALGTAVPYIGLLLFPLCCSSFMLFLLETWSMVTAVNEITRGFLFLGTNGVVIHQLASVNSFTFEKRNLLSFGEAFSMSLPPMVHISMILLSLALNFVLLFRVYPGIQCVLLLLCILMPLYYFAELAHKAAGIAVNLGRSYKMPLIWFSTLGGLGIFLIGGSMVLLIVFLSWLYARRRGLEFQGIRVNGDAIIGAMNA
ncbi:uncharacterized protein LOC107485949 isoform X3 [Arachis duranensis]|uniref:Uncharacterized protein LOC107485949 isoform X3 n=1 Tax=Arachis duranensis TaxID=130453 RepID=A0A9C6TWK2_ARADU|nr:uncharacterized protein LOC107485949 isoform X3 [Arachis duranensis]